VKVARKFCAFFAIADEKTPEPRVRRDANILNKHTILWIVLNLLTTKDLVVFHYEKSGDKNNETE